jgi:hypothetical protein
MDRREALSIVGLIVGGSVVGAGNFLSSCTPKDHKSIFGILDKQQIKTIEEAAETILPKTKESPGAKDVEIGKFVNRFITDCYDTLEQKIFLDGIIKLNEKSVYSFSDDFTELKSGEKIELLLALETEVKTFYNHSENWDKNHYYSMMKQVTILGYLTSELVGTKVLNHVPIPGRFEGCIPYQDGDKGYI